MIIASLNSDNAEKKWLFTLWKFVPTSQMRDRESNNHNKKGHQLCQAAHSLSTQPHSQT